MNGWTILLVILLILVLISLIRVGAEVSYGAEGLILKIRLGQIKLTILPKKEKTDKKKSQKKAPQKEKKPKTNSRAETGKKEAAGQKTSAETQKPAQADGTVSEQRKQEKAHQKDTDKPEEGKNDEAAQEPQKKGGLPVPLMDLISIAIDAVGQVFSHLQIDILHVEYTIGGKTDPAGAAIQYGMLYAGGGTIVPVLENAFYRVKKREIHADIDFESDHSLVYLYLALSIRISQIFAVIGHLGWAFLKSYIKKQRTNQQEGKKNGTEASHQ